MALNGRVGQVIGPFDTVDLLSKDGAIIKYLSAFGDNGPQYIEKLGIVATPGTIVKINGKEIKIITGIYELDNVVSVRSIIFPQGASADAAVDFVY